MSSKSSSFKTILTGLAFLLAVFAFAGNARALVAVVDTYSVDAGGTLTIAAPGVLANDGDPSRGEVANIAVLEFPVLHATSFNLNSDGSFTYVHDGTPPGSDPYSFSYQAVEGSLVSDPIDVFVTATTGTGGPASLRVSFSNLRETSFRSQIGDPPQKRMSFVADPGATATVTGSGASLPTDTFALTLSGDGAPNPGEFDNQLNQYEKLALVAQGRPDKYDLRVDLELASSDQIAGAGTEEVLIFLTDGLLTCSLERIREDF